MKQGREGSQEEKRYQGSCQSGKPELNPPRELSEIVWSTPPSSQRGDEGAGLSTQQFSTLSDAEAPVLVSTSVRLRPGQCHQAWNCRHLQ